MKKLVQGGVKKFSDLRCYLKSDAKYYKKQVGFFSRIVNSLVTNPINTQKYIFKYVVNLRKSEFHLNNSILCNEFSIVSMAHTIFLIFYYWRLRVYGNKTGFQIPPNVCGPGLRIFHYGWIVINEKARIGENLTIYPGVVIGHKSSEGGAPCIGNNCFIGAGAKIFGSIHIGNNVTIAPNSVVTKDVPDNSVVGGIPFRIIKMKK